MGELELGLEVGAWIGVGFGSDLCDVGKMWAPVAGCPLALGRRVEPLDWAWIGMWYATGWLVLELEVWSHSARGTGDFLRR